MVDILVLRSLSYNITQVFPRDEAAEKNAGRVAPISVAFGACV